MNLGRLVRWLTAIVSMGLVIATLWLLSMDTLAQANWIYTATALIAIVGILVIAFAVRMYQRLDELSQKIHLMALAVAFVGTLILVAAWALVTFAGLADDSAFLRRLLMPGPHSSLSIYLLAMMVGLYLVGWFWGRSRYR